MLIPSIDYLHECFDGYRFGYLLWKERPSYHFSSEKVATGWNVRFAGTMAGSVDGKGYRHVIINNRLYRSHRVIYAMYKGYWPENEIDHIDGNRQNNNPKNLREVDRQNNCKNLALSSKSTTGVCGVYFIGRLNKWGAQIKVNGKVIWLGVHETLDEARLARKIAEKRFNFHPNHGRKR